MNEIKEVLPNPRTRVEVIYAGGTISSLATAGGYREGGHVVDLVGGLEERIPGFTKNFQIGNRQVAYTGLSENMDEEYWNEIEGATQRAINNDPNGVVITHGTDSMEQTSRRLQRRLKEQLRQRGIKVVITGANEDLAHPKTDAWDNLTFAFESCDAEQEPGVYVGFHRRLIPADLVVKEPYNGSEMNYISMEDPEYIQAVETQRAQSAEIVARLNETIGADPSRAEYVLEYPVNIVRINHENLMRQIEKSKYKSYFINFIPLGNCKYRKAKFVSS